MPSELPTSEPTLSLDSARQIDRICEAFEKAWIAGPQPGSDTGATNSYKSTYIEQLTACASGRNSAAHR